MADNHNFRVKNGLEVGGVLIVNSSGELQASSLSGAITATSLQLGSDAQPTLTGDGSQLKIQTTGGYVAIGPDNSSWMHFSTDRNSFYFNRKITVNEGIVDSYDEDLQLRRAASTTARLRITAGTTISDQALSVTGALLGSTVQATGNLYGTNGLHTLNAAGNGWNHTINRNSGSPTANLPGGITSGNITTTGYLRGPSTFTIDPAAHGDDTGKVVIAGDLQVDGTTTTVNSTTVAVSDLNFTVAKDAANASAANNAGLTVAGADAQLKYLATGNKWTMNKPLDVSGNLLLDVDNAEINLKSGVGTTSGAINWTFNTAGTDYASIKLPYATRATKGLWMDSGYPITIDATTRIDFDISGSTKMDLDGTGLEVLGTVVATDEFRASVVAYASNQDAPYMIAGTSGYTGATTNWNTFGFQHRIKSSSTGVSRVTIDTYAGEAFSINNNMSATFAGSVTAGGHIITSNSSRIENSRISMEADGTLDWGSAKDSGTLTWDTGKIIVRGHSGKAIEFQTNGTSVAATFDTSQNATFAGNVTSTGVVSASGGNSGNWNTAYGWGNHASAGYLTSYTDTNTHTHLDRTDNRTIAPSEFSTGDLNFGFTSWANDNTSPYADFIHMRSYTDSSGGSDNMVMFKKSGIGMRLWQQTFGSSTAYSNYEDVWHSGNLTTTNKANYDTAYGWGDHASGGYLTSSSTQSKYLRSDAGDSHSGGELTFTTSDGIRFSHANQTDTNDGRIAAGHHASGLNIVGSQTSAGTGRQVRIWGDLITDGGSQYWHAGDFANNSTNWNTAYTTANAALPKAGGTMTGDIVMNASIQLGGNRRILGGTTHRALEAHTNGTQLQLGEGYGLINLFKTQNAVNELKLYNNRQDLSNVGVSKVSGYNGVETSNMTFYRGGGGSSGYIRFQTKPTNAASLTDQFQIGDSSTVGYGVNVPVGGYRINGTTVIDSNRQIFAKGNTQVGEDGTYGNYGVLGFGGITNGYNRVFGRNSTGDGLFLASATGRGVFVRTNGSGSDTFSFTSAGAFQVAGTTVIDSSRNISGQDFKPESGYHYQRSNHHSGHLEGSYNNVAGNGAKSNPIYTIGSSYNPTDNALSNMYGIGYTSTAASFVNPAGGSFNWGMYVAADGDARVWLDGSTGNIWSSGDHYVGSSRVFHDTYHPNADKWTTARTLTLSGDVTGSVSFDGSAAINMTNTVVANDSHTHSIYLPKAGGAMTGAITTNSTFDGRDVATDGAKLDQIKTGGTLATYGTTSSSSGRIRCTAPFNTNSSHMFQVTVSVYSSYTVHTYVVGGYMYSTTNQWHSPTVIYSGGGNPNIVVGRDSNGKAYISIANGNYTGVRVHNMTLGYYTSLADTQDPWTITINGATENSVTPTISKVWHSTNDGIGSGLNADLLDDQHGAYYLNYNNFTNTPTIPQGDITGVTAGTGMTGGGTSGTPILNVIGGSGITANADNITVDSTVLRTNVNQTVTTGQTLFNSGTNMATATGNQSRLEVRGSGSGNDAFMSFHVGGDYATYLGLDGGTNRMSIGGWSMGAVSHAIFHEDYHPNADKWTTARTLTLSGDVTGSVSFDGSAAINMTNTVVANDSHTHSIYLPKAGGTMTGDLTVDSASSWNAGNGMLNVGGTGDGRLQVRHIWGKASTSAGAEHLWLNYQNTSRHVQIGAASGGNNLYVAGELYAQGYFTGQRVFHDNYHPNADVWTTARSHVVTLTGDVTGTATQSVNGSGNKTWTISTAVGNDSHYHSQVYIPDTRGAQRAPSYYPDRYVSYDFQNNADTLAGDDAWHVLQTVAKWSSYASSHRQQQIAYTGPALKHRTATSDSAWGSWKTIWDSSNLVIGDYIPKNANTMTGSAFKLGFHSGSGGTTFGANHYSMGVDVANGSWSGTNYSDLIIGYHTGIRIGAGYSGIRFYDNSPTTDTNNSGNGDGSEELLMTIGGGGSATSGANVTVHNNLTVNDNLYLGDGTDGRFFSDQAGRTAFADGDFYIQSSVGNCYIYATNTYLGNTSGDTIRFRANTVTADSWGITSAGAATFAGVTSNVTGNVTGSSGSCTGNAATVTTHHSDGGGNYPIVWRSGATTYYTDEVYITASTNKITATTFAGALSGNATTATTATTATNATNIYTTQTAGTAGVHYPTFVSVNSSGQKSLKYDPGMMYDPSTNILGDVNFNFKGTLTGSLVGNATTVTQNHSDGGGNYPILWKSGSTTYYTDEVFITASTNTVRAYQFALTAGNSNGIKFWNGSSAYAITMGNNQNNHGTVTDYSIHHEMGTTAGRGFTFGPSRAGVTCSINAITGAILSNNNITAYSDIRIKDNIEVIPNALHKVSQLSGYTFTRTDVEDKEERYTGVIAQEVLKVLPEAVQLGATEEDTMSVAYGNMVGLMIEAIKELKSEVDDLKTQLSQKGK